MAEIRGKDRKTVSKHLRPDENLQALVNLSIGGAGGGASYAQAAGTQVTLDAAYREEHGIEEKGLNGQFDTAHVWFALTDQRLLVFKGSSLGLRPKPKQFLTEFPRSAVTVAWRNARALTDCRLYHFEFPDDQHLVRLGDVDEHADGFVSALGDAASPMPEAD